MERLTKLMVIASNLLALWLLARLVSRGFPPILIPTATAFIVACGAALIFGEITVNVLLAALYFVPETLFAWMGTFTYPFAAIWLAALCGSMLPNSASSRWTFPRRWKPPLVFWSLAIALSWPLVVLREVDFVPALLYRGHLGNSRVGTSPATVVSWTLSMSIIAMTGFLLLDWLFLAYPKGKLKKFESRVVWPLLAGAVVSAMVAVYQSLVDLSFLNRTLFGTIGRAVGTMRDANVFGTCAAMWLPVAAAIAMTPGKKSTWLAPVALASCAILGAGVWTSGSRTALLAAASALIVLFVCSWRRVTLRQAAIALAALVVTLGVILLLAPKFTTDGPWARLFNFVTTPEAPSLTLDGLMFVAHHLWARGGYGTAATEMIREHPLVGIGIGSFNFQYADVLYLIDKTILPPDNAQNWFRHQLAEIGILGSVGWIVWTSMFLWVLVIRRGPDNRRPMVGAAKGAALGLGLASLLGMPTSNFVPSLTFIVIACWCLKLTGAEDEAAAQSATRRRFEWMAIVVLLLAFLGGTAYAGWNELRPPYRALRADFLYQYGFGAPDERDPEFRWTEAKAVDVFHAEKRWLKVVIGAVAPDASQRPVRVRVWFNRQLILRVDRRGNFPITKYIKMPAAYGTPIMIQVETDRTWRAADFGLGADRRERGVAVGQWVFMDEDPAKGSLTVE